MSLVYTTPAFLCRLNITTFYDVLKLLTADGFNGLGEAARRLINEAMRLERQNYLGVGPYERNEDRQGYANGYKPKTVKSRLGELTFAIPQVRDGGFYPSSLEKGMRSERAVKLALAEMYVQGVSTHVGITSGISSGARTEKSECIQTHSLFQHVLYPPVTYI